MAQDISLWVMFCVVVMLCVFTWAAGGILIDLVCWWGKQRGKK